MLRTSVKWLMGYMKKPAYILSKPSVTMSQQDRKIGIVRRHYAKVSHCEFYENLSSCVGIDTRLQKDKLSEETDVGLT
jgi:ABC-type sulfate/molybdate transport systems ATPase subunit